MTLTETLSFSSKLRLRTFSCNSEFPHRWTISPPQLKYSRDEDLAILHGMFCDRKEAESSWFGVSINLLSLQHLATIQIVRLVWSRLQDTTACYVHTLSDASGFLTAKNSELCSMAP